jgi:hypothetical protein
MRYSLYEFEIFEGLEGYIYKIKFYHDYYQCEDCIESEEWYSSETDAINGARAHIDRLENGE